MILSVTDVTHELAFLFLLRYLKLLWVQQVSRVLVVELEDGDGDLGFSH